MIAALDFAVWACWLLVWFVAVIVAAAQILRGRAIAGALIGFAAVGGLVLRLLPGVFDAVGPALVDAIGPEAAYGSWRILLGFGHAAVCALLLLGAAVQRPPRPPA